MEKVEVLLSTMNLRNKEEAIKLIASNKITSDVVIVNQVNNKENLFNFIFENIRVYSFIEKGTSNSRNRLLELANGDICIFADNDTVFVDNYQELILNAYRSNKKADIMIFYASNLNKQREKNKKIGNKKINFFDLMKIRTNEISIKKEVIEKIKNEEIKFNCNFGPNAFFEKGEETVFISDIFNKGFNIYSINIKISNSRNDTSTWFKGYNEKFLYDQGAIFKKITPKYYNLLIMQYIIRKYHLYRKNVSMIKAYNIMNKGANKYTEISENQ